MIQTVYGRALRFSAHVATVLSSTISIVAEVHPSVVDAPIEQTGNPPVIAVPPLSEIEQMAEHSGLPEALSADIRTAPSQLR